VAPCPSPRAAPDPLLVRSVLRLCHLTIAYNVLEGVASVVFGWSDESVALFGFGIDSWIEVASALVVLWRFRGEAGRGSELPLEKERRATLLIAGLFVLLAVGTAAAAIVSLTERSRPASTLPGLVVSGVSLLVMGWLWRAKLRLARLLDSSTVEKDAHCSRACLRLSAILFVGSLFGLVVPRFFGIDAVAALLLAILIGQEGLEGWKAARHPAFSGGCGCGPKGTVS
jgi:divalent metal cation (Fe/Co/Zn/Cd) transporter